MLCDDPAISGGNTLNFPSHAVSLCMLAATDSCSAIPTCWASTVHLLCLGQCTVRCCSTYMRRMRTLCKRRQNSAGSNSMAMSELSCNIGCESLVPALIHEYSAYLRMQHLYHLHTTHHFNKCRGVAAFLQQQPSL